MSFYQEIGRLINQFGIQYKLRPDLIGALIMQESSAMPLASRFEPGFKRKYLDGKRLSHFVPEIKYVPTEYEILQRATSFGLCQIMGQVAREYGIKTTWLTMIYDPAVNIELCCRILNRIMGDQRDEATYRKALLRYNGGGDPDYPDKIFRRIERGEHKRFFEGE